MSLLQLTSSKKKALSLVGSLSLISLMLSGCAVSPEDEAKINSVTTALPQDIEGCTFLGDVSNTYSEYSIQEARNDLKLRVADMGGNHLVETHLISDGNVAFDPFWDRGYVGNMNGFFMSGRAYYCPVGKGVIKAAPTNVTVPQKVVTTPGFATGPYSSTPAAN